MHSLTSYTRRRVGSAGGSGPVGRRAWFDEFGGATHLQRTTHNTVRHRFTASYDVQQTNSTSVRDQSTLLDSHGPSKSRHCEMGLETSGVKAHRYAAREMATVGGSWHRYTKSFQKDDTGPIHGLRERKRQAAGV